MKIDINKCKNCHLCIKVCPSKILDTNKNNQTYFIDERKHICLECGQCMAICNTQAITVNELSYENNFLLIKDNKIGYNDFYNLLKTRRSVREFKNKSIEKEKIQQILNAISTAPYGTIDDGISISVITNKEIIDKSLPLMSEFYTKLVKKNFKTLTKKNCNNIIYNWL